MQVAATDTDDLGGVIFRALDHENFWYCVYDADNDRLVLAERKENTDTVYGTKSSMGWSISTWYYIDVEYSYNYISVYAGTSPANLALQFQHEVDGVPDGTSFTFDNIPLMEGSQGYYGHGYSEYSPTYPSFPAPPPLPEDPDPWPTQVYAGAWDGVYYTSNFSGPTGGDPTWTDISSGLGDYKAAYTFVADPVNPSSYIYGLFQDINTWIDLDAKVFRRNAGAWTEILDQTDCDNVIGHGGDTCKIGGIGIDVSTGGRLYATVINVTDDDLWIIRSDDYGDTWGNAVLVQSWYDWWYGQDPDNYQGGWTIHADGTHVVIHGEHYWQYDASDYDTTAVWRSDDTGGTWSLDGMVDNVYPGYSCAVIFNSLNTREFFHVASTGDNIGYLVDDNPSTGGGDDEWGYDYIDTIPSPSISTYLHRAIQMSDTVSGYGKACDNYGPGTTWITDDYWATVTEVDAETDPDTDKAREDIDMLWFNPDDPDLMIYASRTNPNATYPHVIFVSTNNGARLYGKGGPNVDTSPYTDSIYSGLTYGGLLVIPPS